MAWIVRRHYGQFRSAISTVLAAALERGHSARMTTRFHCWLRTLLAVVTFACAAVAVTADPAAAAPRVVIVAPVSERAPSQISQRAADASRPVARARPLAKAQFARVVSATCVRVLAPALMRAPRLYLRNCVLLC